MLWIWISKNIMPCHTKQQSKTTIKNLFGLGLKLEPILMPRRYMI